MKKADIQNGKWFKKKNSSVATFRFTHVLKDNMISYESHFDNYAGCEYMIGKGRGIKECVSGGMLDINHLLNSDEYEAQGDSPNYYDDYEEVVKNPTYILSGMPCVKNSIAIGMNLVVNEPNVIVMGMGREQLKLCANGNIYVNGKMAGNDKEFVDAFRDFVKGIPSAEREK